ncbi:tetratricopeptide repeat protein [Crocosphaera sp. UHCC 0190]|uniref:tetratricopeptide repeat protein n=1 Tax=Crocosphaera sp. UHCC 0190 TaxID=3110246 RepID=UPI002B1E9862|nr:tetratricopeptide repeat protein [Crocosphaera sp. UHCC 0190]MEA5510121.1 tetratricopeptide repeat protein [Crocosphaera sp. UHCC 0190]
MESQVETQELENQSSGNNLSDIFDLLSGVGLFGGVVGSFFGNAAFATIPLSFSLALQMANRRQLKVEMAQVQQTAIMQLTEQINNNKSVIFEQFNQLHQETQNNWEKQNQAFQSKVNDLSDKLQDSQQSLDGLMQEDRKLNEFTNALNAQQQQVEEIVKSLQQIENLSQVIRSNPDGVEAYYQRGLSHQKLGDKTGAIEDYTEALHLDSTYAKAYHSRGILLAELGSKKQAVEDLRLAAKYYFEQGDIESYEQARNLSKEFYEVRHSLINDEESEVTNSEESMIKGDTSQMIDLIAVGNLFDEESGTEKNVSILG